MSTFKELFKEELADIYDAEKQLLKALPKMAKSAEAPELKEAFQQHLEETKGHVERLERVFELQDEKPKKKACKAMKGLIEEGEEIIKDHEKSPVRDAALISAAQKVEHYEMAAYGCLSTWAELMEQDEIANVLKETLDEEKQADEKLTTIAETSINMEASEEGEDQEAVHSSKGSDE